jgi:hypothetical protein
MTPERTTLTQARKPAPALRRGLTMQPAHHHPEVPGQARDEVATHQPVTLIIGSGTPG